MRRTVLPSQFGLIIWFNHFRTGIPEAAQMRIGVSDLATTVIPRAGGESSTPWLIDSISVVSGILGRPVKPGDDDLFAFLRCDARLAP
jgi:hypothetical protein